MVSCPNGVERINLFAAVVYIPDPLATFLDDLRKEMVPGCVVHAHVTVLPPRPLQVGPEAAVTAARSVAEDFVPFVIEAGEVEIFRATDVIYIGIKEGADQLREMYKALNRGPLAFQEAFAYHPHITLAQGLVPDQVDRLYTLARDRWQAFPHAKRLFADRMHFVQSTNACTWLDLAEFSLRGVPVP